MRALFAGMTRVRVLNLRELAGHRLRVATSLIVVVVSAGLLIAVLGAYGSMTESVREFNATVSGAATVEVASIADSGVPQGIAAELRREVHEAKAVVPLIRGTVRVHDAPVVLLGSDYRVSSLSPQLRSAFEGASTDVDPEQLEGGIVVGSGVGLTEGQSVKIGSTTVKVLRVIDDPAADSLNSGRFVFAYLPLAQKLSGLNDSVDSILLVPAPGVSNDTLRARVTEVVDGRAAVLNPDFRVKQTEVATAVVRDSTLLLSMVSLVIAAFLVFNTMNMAVASRRQSLAMIRALGARRRHLVGDLLAEAAVFGLVGGLLGIPVGIVAGRWIIGRLPDAQGAVAIDIGYHLPGYAAPVAVAACVVACVGATMLAARSVFAVAPVEAMVPGEAADAALPKDWLRWFCATLGLGLIVASYGLSTVVEGRPAILLGAVYSVGALVLCFGVLVPLVRCVVAVSGWFRGPGRLAAVNGGRAPRRVWATVMTVGVAIAVGVGTSGALDNMVGSISGSLAGLEDPDMYVSSRSADQVPLGPPLDPVIADQVAKTRGVKSVVGAQWASVNVGDARALIQGLEPGSSAPFMRKADPQALRQTLDGDGILLSKVLARSLGVGVGDTLRLATPTGYHELVVRDTVNYVTIDSGTGAMSNQLLGKWFNRPGATYLQVELEPGADRSAVEGQVRAIADAHPGAGGMPVHVYSGAAALAASQRNVEQSGAFTVAIQWVVAGAAAIALLNTLLLSVLERRRELAVLRSMGASRRFVRAMVLSEAASVAAVGAVVGVVMGSGLHFLSDRILSETTSIDILYRPQWSALGYVVAAALLCFVGALVPAVRAGRMNISQALVSD